MSKPNTILTTRLSPTGSRLEFDLRMAYAKLQEAEVQRVANICRLGHLPWLASGSARFIVKGRNAELTGASGAVAAKRPVE